MTPRDKKRIREHVQWTMMHIPPEFRRADKRAVIRQAIRIVKGVDTAARNAVEGPSP